MKLASQEADFICGRDGVKTKVKELRTAAGMTQQQLAERVHVSARTIISIEKEQYSPSLMLAYRMAEVFGVTSFAVFGKIGNGRTGSMRICHKRRLPGHWCGRVWKDLLEGEDLS